MRVIGRSAKGGMGSQFSCRRSELFANTIGPPPSCLASSQHPARFLPLPGDRPIFAELEWLGKLGKAESNQKRVDQDVLERDEVVNMRFGSVPR